MTTDTFPKKIAVEIEIHGKKVTIAGIAKGSGMIHPNMGTMLAYITTDVNNLEPKFQITKPHLIFFYVVLRHFQVAFLFF